MSARSSTSGTWSDQPGLDGRGVDRERGDLRGERRRDVEVVELRALPGADVAAGAARAAGAVGGRRRRLGDEGLRPPRARAPGPRRAAPPPGRRTARPCEVWRHVEVAAEDDPRPVGGVEERQEVRDDPVHRGERGAVEHAVDRDERDRLDAGHRQAGDGDRARVRLVQQVAALRPRVADRADRLDRRPPGRARRPPSPSCGARRSRRTRRGPAACPAAVPPPGRVRPARRSPRRGAPRRRAGCRSAGAAGASG